MSTARCGLIELLAGYAAASFLHDALRCRIFDSMHEWQTPIDVAKKHDLESTGTRVILEFLFRETDLLQKRGERFRLAPNYVKHRAWRGIVEKFIGAYGQHLRSPIAALRPRSDINIDQRALARAYTWDSESPAVVAAITELSPQAVLDVGCGRGGLLEQLCTRVDIRGWGIDVSKPMCREARKAIASAGLAKRVFIRHGSATSIGAILDAEERRQISVIHLGSLMNEFARDDQSMVALLTRFTRWFPGRSIVVVDYLGALGDSPRAAGRYTHLNDVVQALSGQGVPPSSHEHWNRIYRAAGARLIRAVEGRTLDLRWFIHTVRLGYPSPGQRRSTRA